MPGVGGRVTKKLMATQAIVLNHLMMERTRGRKRHTLTLPHVAAVTYLRLATKNDARNIVCMDLKRSSWMGQELLFFLNGS